MTLATFVWTRVSCFSITLRWLALGLLGAAACADDVSSAAAPRPDWAVEAGQDSYGSWADFEVAGQRIRMRKLRKGTFSMGSAEGEPGRAPDEQRHEVRKTR